MFNLEQQVKGWRTKMMSAGLQSTDLLDELESHLREEFDQQRTAGLAENEAFATAIAKIGNGNLVGNEYQKLDTHSGAWFRNLRAMRTFVMIASCIEFVDLVLRAITRTRYIFGIDHGLVWVTQHHIYWDLFDARNLVWQLLFFTLLLLVPWWRMAPGIRWPCTVLFSGWGLMCGGAMLQTIFRSDHAFLPDTMPLTTAYIVHVIWLVRRHQRSWRISGIA
jgi:hypothetical protein